MYQKILSVQMLITEVAKNITYPNSLSLLEGGIFEGKERKIRR